MLGFLILAATFGYIPNAPTCTLLHVPHVRPHIATQKSVARGRHTNGSLISPARVPVNGKALAVLPGEHRQRGRNYGISDLVNALTIVASELRDRYQNTTVYIGDISAKRGGRITHHRSHQTGLDVDIAFFYRDSKGKLVTPTGFWHIGEDGLTSTSGQYTLDPALNWDLVEGLLRSSQIEVQWIFVSKPIKEQLLAAGRAKGAPEEILKRAETILHQPTRGLPHDDHFHLRIYCPPAQRLEGCEDSGPVWAWVVQPPPADSEDVILVADTQPEGSSTNDSPSTTREDTTPKDARWALPLTWSRGTFGVLPQPTPEQSREEEEILP